MFPLFFAARKFLISSLSAGAAVAWYAVHSFHIQAGYNMRPYALLQFLFPLTLFVFFKKDWNNKFQTLFWNLLFIFLLFWDYAAIWFIAAFFIFKIVEYKNIKTFIFFIIEKFWLLLLAGPFWLFLFLKSLHSALDLESYIKTDILGVLTTTIFGNLQTITINQHIEAGTLGVILITILILY